MLFELLESLSLIHPRILVEILPKTTEWIDLELRGAILLSLLSQVALILFGNRRKYIPGNCIKVVLWIAYQAASWAATFALSAISKSFTCSKLDEAYMATMAFWAPFLLVHLGGPDTITALALEDNELWLRNVFGLFTQLYLASSIIGQSWTISSLSVLSILVLIVGVIKYVERSWILWAVSRDQFRNSLIHDPDPGPNYAKFMDEFSSKQAEGFRVSLKPLTGAPVDLVFALDPPRNSDIPNAKILIAADYFFVKFKPLFGDLILSFQDGKNSQSFFQDKNWKEAFDLIGYELSFMFDTLYTKAILIFSPKYRFIRVINLSLQIAVLVAFFLIEEQPDSLVDMCITYLVMGGAVVLELYAAITLLFSDWTILSLSRHKNLLVDLTYKVISLSQPLFQLLHLVPASDKWSNSIAGYNLINFCLVKRPVKCSKAHKVWIEMWQSNRYTSLQVIPDYLKELVFAELKKKSSQASDFVNCKRLCAQRGDEVLKERMCYNKIGWSVEVEFDHSILLWHVATDLCYHSDLDNNANIVESPVCKVSKLLSDYMLHLLVELPFMLPSGIGMIRYQDTCAEAMEFFQERKYHLYGDQECAKVKACTALLNVNTAIRPSEVKGHRSKSVLFDACRLAHSLQSLKLDHAWAKNKWEMICDVWIEMLSYAANQCSFIDHAKQLREGGELLTHVCLVMTHLGISEKFQIAESYERVRVETA